MLHSRLSKTMNSYQKAIKALEECVKDAMENDVDPGLQMEIWRHYQGVKAIQRQLPKETNLSFKLDGIDRVMEMYDSEYPTQAAQPVDVGLGGFGQGNDVITFG
ncbi:hypothetical protein Syn33_207 [Prochlorococcus phage Syn33]|uniref:Uncharacterized protein n=4 Tax=Brizovirus syn33 TaxID=2734097 RepID=E3SR93_9CAUD|nr:virion structural protein [Prochlorococcus phage Syn33]ADO99577.1 hypothetical protein Syn33_207 [Prochlorococcus phage Syn33]